MGRASLLRARTDGRERFSMISVIRSKKRHAELIKIIANNHDYGKSYAQRDEKALQPTGFSQISSRLQGK